MLTTQSALPMAGKTKGWLEGVGPEWRKMEESKLQKACGREWMSELEKKERSGDGEQGNCSVPGLHQAQRRGKRNG